MQKTLVLLFTALSLSLVACHSDVPKASVPAPKASTSLQPTNENPDPKNRNCDAMKDPAQAEDCRLWKKVAEAKEKHNSNNVLKHNPGSIQQP